MSELCTDNAGLARNRQGVRAIPQVALEDHGGGQEKDIGKSQSAQFAFKKIRLGGAQPGLTQTSRLRLGGGGLLRMAGSGGAIVGTYDDEAMFANLTAAARAIGIAVIKPKIVV